MRSPFVSSVITWVAVAVALFNAALDIVSFWIYLGIFVALSIAGLLIIDPEPTRERMRPGGRPIDWRYAISRC